MTGYQHIKSWDKVSGEKGKSRNRKIWKECVSNYFSKRSFKKKKLYIRKEVVQDSICWSNPCKHGNKDTKNDDDDNDDDDEGMLY
jgi:hypothetical protein